MRNHFFRYIENITESFKFTFRAEKMEDLSDAKVRLICTAFTSVFGFSAIVFGNWLDNQELTK